MNTIFRRRGRQGFLKTILPFVFLSLSLPTLGNAGSPNPAFGDNGWAVNNFSDTFVQNEGRDVAVQPDHKIVVVGTNLGPQFDVILARYNADGTIDTSFDNDGRVVINVGGEDRGNAVVVQSDGKIIVAGATLAGSRSRILVVRLNSDGSPDSSFGSDGIVITEFPSDSTAREIAIQPDGKIVVVGDNSSTGFPIGFVVVRYNIDGSLDTNFDSDGKVVTSISGPSSAHSVALQSNGKILVGGRTEGLFELALARYNTDGSLDTSFDSDGFVTTSDQFSGNSITGLAVQADNKIVAITTMPGVAGAEIHVLRYETNGALDTTFDTDGMAGVTIPDAESGGLSIALQPDGKILAGGQGQDYNSFNSVYVMARLETNGALDTSFDGDGYIMTPLSPSAPNIAGRFDVQVDGKIVQAGMSNSNFGVVRYNQDGTLDTAGFSVADTPGIEITSFSGKDRAENRAVVVQSDGKIIVGGLTNDAFNFNEDATIARYNPDGTLDNFFDADGQVSLSFSSGFQDESINGLALQADGKILAVDAVRPSPSASDAGILRLNSNGSVDNSFGSSGIVATNIDVNDVWNDVLVQPDGKIVVVGNANDLFGSGANDMVVARFDSGGVLDPAFATGGIFRSPIMRSAHDVKILPSGSLLVAGQAEDQGFLFTAVAKLNCSGVLDPLFGPNNGHFVSTLRSPFEERFSPLAVNSNGNIVITGFGYPNFIDSDVQVAQYNKYGYPDIFFGADGIVSTDLGGNEQGHEIAIQGDGKILVGGFTRDDEMTEDFMLIRYLVDGSLDTAFANGGVGTYDGGESEAISRAMAFTDGHVYLAGQARKSAALLDVAVADGIRDLGISAIGSLIDINGNGFPEVAVTMPGSTQVDIRDGSTAALIAEIDFGDDPKTAMAVIDDISGNGMPEIAMLGTRPDGSVRVQVKDSDSGLTVKNVFYGSTFSAVNMTVLPDTDGNSADELLVVGADCNGGVRAQARDALSGLATSTTFYGANVPPQDVVTIPDVSGNGEPEVLMHGRVTASGQGRVQMRDSATKALLGNFFFGTAYVPIGLVTIDDVSGDGVPDLAQLGRRDDTGAVRIQVKRSDTGVTVSNAFTGDVDMPIVLLGIGDANGNTSPDVAMLVKRPDGTAKVVVRDGATGAFIRNIFAGAVSNPVAMTLLDDLDLSGEPELAILGDDNAGMPRVQIKDSISGAQVNTIDFP